MLTILYPDQLSKVPTSGKAKVTAPPIVKAKADDNKTFLGDGKPENATDCKTHKAPSGAEENHPPSSIQEGTYSIQIDAIPPSLRALRNWVHWKLEQNGKGRT